MSDRMQIVREFWGQDVPDWIKALVEACDAPGSSQSRVARRLGYTGGVVSQVLRRDYLGNMGRFEDRVRSIYMAGHVTCPALGDIDSAACLNWRDRSGSLNSVAPMVVRMFRACRDCPRNRRVIEEEDAA